MGFHFSRGSSCQVSGASGKFSPSWWGEVRAGLQSGLKFSPWCIQRRVSINDSSGVKWQDNINLLFILSYFGQGLFVHPVFHPPQGQTLVISSPALLLPPDSPPSMGVSGSPVTPFTHVPPCPTIPSLSDRESLSSLRGIREVQRQ